MTTFQKLLIFDAVAVIATLAILGDLIFEFIQDVRRRLRK